MTAASAPVLVAAPGGLPGPDWLLPALLVAALVAAGSLWRRAQGRRRRAGRRGRGGAGTPTGRAPRVGEIWWADVPFEERRGSKDRPCLVVGTRGHRRQVLMISSQDKSGRPGWLPLDRAGWARGPGVSWLRLDRRVALAPGAFRRLAGPCPPAVWARVEASGRGRGATR